MKITAIETLRADAGWRMFSFLKVMTDSGIVGWSEYNESFGSPGLSGVIETLAPLLVGQDPRRSERVTAMLHVNTRQSQGGLIAQAVAAVENALLDIRGKDLGVPVAALFGGPVRDRIPVYWSHMGTYRVRNADVLGVAPLRSYEDVSRHAAEIRGRGFKAMKTNTLVMRDGALGPFSPGFGRTPGWPELNWTAEILTAIERTLGAIRDGAGNDVGLMLDVNFHFKTEGFARVADTIAPFKLSWLEIDTHDARSLALLRSRAPCPIASCETLCGRRDFKPFFEQYAMDVPIIDVPWNGLAEAVKIAAMADAYEMNVAPHNFYGHLCTMHSAHFCASIPNLRVMEIDIDSAPWRDEFVTAVPVIEDGELVLPTATGWGMDINEKAVRARPPKG
jgi:galactonate dehydratase